jgi:hypothetical protein
MVSEFKRAREKVHMEGYGVAQALEKQIVGTAPTTASLGWFRT